MYFITTLHRNLYSEYRKNTLCQSFRIVVVPSVLPSFLPDYCHSFSSDFLVESMTSKSLFEINWPLSFCLLTTKYWQHKVVSALRKYYNIQRFSRKDFFQRSRKLSCPCFRMIVWALQKILKTSLVHWGCQSK